MQKQDTVSYKASFPVGYISNPAYLLLLLLLF